MLVWLQRGYLQCSCDRGQIHDELCEAAGFGAPPVYVLAAIADKELGHLSPYKIFADSRRDRIRENRHFRSVFQTTGGPVPERRVVHAIESIGLIVEQP